MKLHSITVVLGLTLAVPGICFAQDDFDFTDSSDEGDEDVEVGDEDLDADTDPGDLDLGDGDDPDDGDTDDDTDDGLEGESDTEEPPSKAETKGAPEEDRIKAVSRKRFLKKNRLELTPSVGLSVNDSFFRNYVMQLDLSYHIVESFSVELRLGWPFTSQYLEPYDMLRDQQKVLTGIVRPAYMVDLSGTFTPVYGKTTLFSKWIWYYDLYVAGGVGLTGIGILSQNSDISNLLHQPTLNVGCGVRTFVTDWMVVHVDLRNYSYSSLTDGLSLIQNLLVLSAGVGFWIPWDFEYEYEGYKVVS